MSERHVYLDYNATTPVGEEAQAALVASLPLYGNASSMHEAGRLARFHVEEARRDVAALIAADAKNLFFTSGASESNNTIFETMRRLVTERTPKPAKNEIIVSAIEHPCVFNSAKYLKSLGMNVCFLPVDENGKIKMDEYKKTLNERTLLVSVMMANNEIGTIQDIKEIAALAKDAGALTHTDAAQAAGKIPVDVNGLNVDYLTMSAHKIYGLKGAGALYKKSGAPLLPLIHGGHQEDGLRAGTYNNTGILCYGAAAKAAKEKLGAYMKTMSGLRDRLKNGLLASVPMLKINGHPEDVLPNTLNVSFPGAEGEAILLSLDIKGIEASTGSACASGSLDPSHVLMAIGVWPELAHGSIRFSLGWGISEADIDYVLEVTPPIIKRLRAMSTVACCNLGNLSKA